MAFGPLTVDGWNDHRVRTGEHLHVLLNGTDVTTRCKFADDRQGIVTLYYLDAQGRKVCIGGAVKLEIRRGHVQIIAGEPFPAAGAAA